MKTLGKTALVILGLGAAAMASLMATDESWAIPMILAAPNDHGVAPSPPPPVDARPLTSDAAGERIDAWVLEPATMPRSTVFVLHGIRDRKDSMLPLGRALTRDGHRVVLVDLRGHGASTGEFLTYGARDAEDLVGLLDALDAEGLMTERLGVYGVSFGAASAITFASLDPRVDAVVALAPFASLRAVVPDYVRLVAGPIERVVPNAWISSVVERAAERGGFEPDDACPACVVPNFGGALYVAHGGADQRIPPPHGDAIAAEHGGRTVHRVFPAATHGTINMHASDEARAFLQHALRPESATPEPESATPEG